MFPVFLYDPSLFGNLVLNFVQQEIRQHGLRLTWRSFLELIELPVALFTWQQKCFAAIIVSIIYLSFLSSRPPLFGSFHWLNFDDFACWIQSQIYVNLFSSCNLLTTWNSTFGGSDVSIPGAVRFSVLLKSYQNVLFQKQLLQLSVLLRHRMHPATFFVEVTYQTCWQCWRRL